MQASSVHLILENNEFFLIFLENHDIIHLNIRKKSMKMDKVAGSGNDEFYTPQYAVMPILKYVKPNSRVLCPFDTKDSWFVKLLSGGGLAL